ncbi:Nucleolar protein 11 [Orchesella cincta]|uniref:Nucleolar protein 11 n=1 Tax=Orchesella cincta TaxID=48709 RepID=A0A1D2MLI4_ORCCI|nr:Nucleolar protein 11 [Orchesella cincta]
MASLSPPFILCPLPDRKALLGIRQDSSVNKAIVTLGKNIAIRYHVLEQKQESSWTTSRYWFTSPVTYCYDFGKYGAVLNHNIIALWQEADATLSNISKIKFSDEVFGLHSSPNGRTVVVMKNGNVAYLDDVSGNKSLVKDAILSGGESITYFEVDDKSNLCYLFTSIEDKGHQKLQVVTMKIDGEGAEKVNSRCEFGSDTDKMLGSCLHKDISESFVAYFGSDGCIRKKKLMAGSNEIDRIKLANLSKYISKANPVTMCPLADNSSIAIYGSDPAEEGAVVIIYDIHYDLVVSKQSLKLYSVPPLMEKIGQSLVVPLGLHILVLGFRITKSLLSAVVGKHQAKLDEEVFEERNPWNTTAWDPDTEIANISASSNTNKNATDGKELEAVKQAYPVIWETIQQVKVFENEGQPEAVICNHVIPAALEANNSSALDWILDTFSDIPEVHVVSMVVFSLKEVKESNEVNERLNKLLLRKFDKQLLTSSLRHIPYEEVKKLLGYLNALIETNWELKIDYEDESSMKSWLKWCSALIDAHYTKFVLHSETDIIENLLQAICECTKVMEAVQEMEPFLVLTYSKNFFRT